MNLMNKLILAAVLLTATLAGAHETRADPGFKITVNGPSLTGMALESLETSQPIISSVHLPSTDLPRGSNLVVASGGGEKPGTGPTDPK